MLVVEDNPELAELVHDVLVDAGYVVAVARDADEALARYCEMDRNCLVLLDMHLPSGSGADVLTRLQDVSRFAGTVVAVTGAPHTDAPVVEVLRKPYELGQLLALVRRSCG